MGVGTADNVKMRETPAYQDTAFPVSMHIITKTDIFPKGRGFHDIHWHDEIQFTYVTRGNITIQIDGKQYILEEGEAAFVSSGVVHMTSAMSDDGEYVGFMFPEKLLGFFAGSRMEQNYVVPYVTNYALSAMVLNKNTEEHWKDEVLEDLRGLMDVFFRHKELVAYEYEISVILVNIWLKMLRGTTNSVRKPSKTYIRRQERLRCMIKFITDHYSEAITLKEIADAASVSTEEARRCFKDVLRESPVHYLVSYRVTIGMELLRNTDLPVTDIAYRVGFNDTSYFIQAFKTKNGMTPRDYRNKIF